MTTIETLESKSKWVRQRVLEMVSHAGHGHIGSSLSCVELLVTLYLAPLLIYDAQKPDWQERDRFIMSKGHAAEALYAVLAAAGYFSESTLAWYGEPGCPLGGEPSHHVAGVEVIGGSLGHGLNIGAGMALAARMDGQDWRTVVMLGDAECYEGSVWEAAMFASHHGLNNLIGIIDRNHLAILGGTEKILRLEPLTEKWQAFGWRVMRLDGHDPDEIIQRWEFATYPSNRPTMLIADTVKGKGISFMENDPQWHHGVPKGEQLEIARKELGLGA
ncbi:MAG: transketolase [Dehalococcoidia bacterium]|nr:transketolase [Dehalococcoidia bacterium]